MPEKCIIYSNPLGEVLASRCIYDNIVSRHKIYTLELSDKERISQAFKHHKHYSLASLGLTPSGVFGAYFALSPHQSRSRKGNIQEMIILDMLTITPIYSFHDGDSLIKSISLKSGASLVYTVKTDEESFSSEILKNGKKGAGIRPINKKQDIASPYIISPKEIFFPKTGNTLISDKKIILPQEMHLQSLEHAFKEKAPERFESVSSFFE